MTLPDCFFIGLKMAAYACGSYTLLVSLVVTAYLVYYKIEQDSPHGDFHTTAADSDSHLSTFITVLIVSMVILFLLSCLMMYGVRSRTKCFAVPWILYGLLESAVLAIAVNDSEAQLLDRSAGGELSAREHRVYVLVLVHVALSLAAIALVITHVCVGRERTKVQPIRVQQQAQYEDGEGKQRPAQGESSGGDTENTIDIVDMCRRQEMRENTVSTSSAETLEDDDIDGNTDEDGELHVEGDGDAPEDDIGLGYINESYQNSETPRPSTASRSSRSGSRSGKRAAPHPPPPPRRPIRLEPLQGAPVIRTGVPAAGVNEALGLHRLNNIGLPGQTSM